MHALPETASLPSLGIASPAGVVAARAPACLDPLRDSGWDVRLAAFSQATFFHTTAWARVLREAYGHTPAYFALGSSGRDQVLFPVMEVNSPLTGRRGVALPFTDECPALGVNTADLATGYDQIMNYGRTRGWKYFEARGGFAAWPGATPSLEFFGHQLDLTAGETSLFGRLESSVRRGVRKAQSAGLKVERSASLEAISGFYRLHCGTRRRHGVPPQPFRFFGSIQRHVLAPGHGTVFSVSHAGRILAAAVFFHHGRHAIYKFGASDLAAQELRPNNLLMWEAIRHYAGLGCELLDFGRTSVGNAGLRRFKRGFGCSERQLAYARYDFRRSAFVAQVDRAEGAANRLLGRLPPPVFRMLGALLYPHLS